ncbi:MAG: hypothetical protein HFG54_01485 [Lachnospiraceae bacterium]|jgi:hypothetical protein|nr:hypothetical protein [Lachnospiraceae bacterium]
METGTARGKQAPKRRLCSGCIHSQSGAGWLRGLQVWGGKGGALPGGEGAFVGFFGVWFFWVGVLLTGSSLAGFSLVGSSLIGFFLVDSSLAGSSLIGFSLVGSFLLGYLLWICLCGVPCAFIMES